MNPRSVPINQTASSFCRFISSAYRSPIKVAVNVNTDELGDLGLTPEEEAAIVAFLKTLSDGF